MPSLEEHESSRLVKALVAADSGSGKTGAIASLVDAGLNVRVLDFDNGLSPLKNYIKDRSKLKNVRFATLQDQLRLQGGKFMIQSATAFQTAMDLLDKGGGLWGDDVPPVTQWTPNDLLLIDTLGTMSRSCLLMVMQINGALAKNPEIQHYGMAMENIEKMLDKVTSASIGCHVIVNTHLTKEEGSPKLYPEAIGSKLNPKIARKFDNFWSIEVVGDKRQIKTSRSGLLALKTAKPIEEKYPIETGLADIFRAMLDIPKDQPLGVDALATPSAN